MELIAEPYVGALPIRFGMKPDDVAGVVGAASRVFPGVFGTTAEERPNLMIGYTENENSVFEINCHVGTILLYRGTDLLTHPGPIEYLRQFDATPVLWVGLVLFLHLGIQLSGFHDADESQRAISMVMKETWSEFVDDFTPF
jgi:hypothetical protein